MEMISSTQYLDDVLEGEESEEELYTDNEEEESINKEDAILSWLWTFPQIKVCKVWPRRNIPKLGGGEG